MRVNGAAYVVCYFVVPPLRLFFPLFRRKVMNSVFAQKHLWLGLVVRSTLNAEEAHNYKCVS